MAYSFLFGGDTQETPATLARKREMADLLASQLMGDTPKNAYEGIGAMLKGAAVGIGRHRDGKAEKAGRSAADDLFNRIIGQAPDVSASSMLSPGIKPASTSTGAGTASTSPQPAVDISGSKAEFVNALLPAAIEESKRTGVDPRIIVAQAAQETGWGKSAPGNNFFGIKSHGKGGGQSLNTHEYVNGKRVNVKDSFRTFGSPGESVRGYGDFILENPRYKALREAQGLDAQLAALQASGYATDPNYSRSVGAIARGIQLPQEVASLDPAIGMPPQTAAGAVNALAAGGGGGAPPPSLSEEVAAFEQTPEYRAQFPGMSAQQPQEQSAPQGIPPQLQGSQQLANAQGGIMPALMGGAPASPDQVAQAQAMGQQQPPQQAPAQGGPDKMALLQALSNPWLSQEQKAVLQTLYQQQEQEEQAAREQQVWMQRQQYEAEQKRNDPAYQIGLEKSRLDLEEAKKPKQQPLVNAGDGQVYDPNSKQWITPPNGSRKPPQVVELFDEATGQPYKATWNPETQEYERVGGVKARSGMQLTTNPDGTVTLTEGAIGGLPKLTEAEGRNSGFYGRGVESHKILNDLESEGTSLWNNTVGNVPIAGNYLRSEDAQRYDQAKRDYINAVLRRESGAVISPEEFKNAEQQYFPQPGDGPDVIEQKRRNRETTIQGLKISAGQGAAFAVPSEQPSQQQKRGPVSIGGYTIEEVD